MSFLRGRSGEQTKNFLSSFWRLPPAPPSAFRKVRKFLGLLRARYERAPRRGITPPRARMRTQKHKATTRSARCNHCPFSKWVRAKVSRSPRVQNSTQWVHILFAEREQANSFACVGIRKPQRCEPANERGGVEST